MKGIFYLALTDSEATCAEMMNIIKKIRGHS